MGDGVEERRKMAEGGRTKWRGRRVGRGEGMEGSEGMRGRRGTRGGRRRRGESVEKGVQVVGDGVEGRKSNCFYRVLLNKMQPHGQFQASSSDSSGGI